MSLTKTKLYQLECHVLLCLRKPNTRIEIPDRKRQPPQIQENTDDKMELYHIYLDSKDTC
jgi:hypothetical protein